MAEYFEFDVSLKYAKPKIYRSFLLEKSATFKTLHDAIQDACGWYDSHLYSFREPGRDGEEIASSPDFDEGLGVQCAPPSNKVKVAKFFSTSDKCLYIYDFGDNWEHEVKLKGIRSDETTFKRKLLGGKRAFPPEDCGSIPGYETCSAVAAGKIKDEDNLKEWLPKGWHPERFDLDKAKKRFDK